MRFSAPQKQPMPSTMDSVLAALAMIGVTINNTPNIAMNFLVIENMLYLQR